MSAPVRVACLGAGYFGQFHYDAWKRMDDVDLVGSTDHDIAKAKATGVAAYSDLAKMLDELKPDLLDIITPPVAHFEAIKLAVAAGVKTIICQKPFCTSLDEARMAVELAEASDTLIVIHENFRFQPWYRAIADELAAGAIGDVQQMTFRLRTGDGQGPNAYLDRQPYFQTMPRLLVHETGVHFIDTFQFLLGPIKAVYADLRRLNPVIKGEDAAYVVFDFDGGVKAVFDGNRHLDHPAVNHRVTLGEAMIEGTKGTLTVSGDGSVHKRKFGEIETVAVVEPQAWSGFGGDCVYALQKSVINGLLKNSKQENIARDYLRIIEIEEAVYRSAQMQKKLEV